MQKRKKNFDSYVMALKNLRVDDRFNCKTYNYKISRRKHRRKSL